MTGRHPDGPQDGAPRPPRLKVHRRVRELLDAEPDSLTRTGRALAYFLKLIRETWRELQEKNCTLRASALAYKSLVTLVPLVAILMAMMSFPGLEARRDRVLDKVLNVILPVEEGATLLEPTGGPRRPEPPPDQEAGRPGAGDQAVAHEIRARRTKMKDLFRARIQELAKRATAVSSIGFVILMLVVISLLSTVEQTFNRIWGAPRDRGWLARMVRYTALLFWGPILIAVSLSLSAAFQTGLIGRLLERHLAGFQEVVSFLLPVAVSTAAFTGLYCVLPNTRVRLRPALAGAVLAAVLWELAKVGFNLYVKHVVAGNPVYGSLGLIPMVFLWLYYSWLVILFGSSVSFTIQNFEDLTRKEERRRRGFRFRVYYAVRTLAAVAANYSRGRSATVVDELSERLDIPEYVVRESLDALAAGGLLVPVEGQMDAYLPSRPLERISVADALQAVAGEMLRLPDGPADPTHRRLAGILGEADARVAGSLGAVSFRDLAAEELSAREGPAAARPPSPDAAGA